MVAGAKYRGDFEERIKCLMDEVREHPEIILFIDEIQNVTGLLASLKSIVEEDKTNKNNKR